MEERIKHWKNKGRFYEIFLNTTLNDKPLSLVLRFSKPRVIRRLSNSEKCTLYLSGLYDNSKTYYYFVNNYLIDLSKFSNNWLEFSLLIDLMFDDFYKDTLELYKRVKKLNNKEKKLMRSNLEKSFYNSISKVKETFNDLEKKEYIYLMVLNLNTGKMKFELLDLMECLPFTFSKFLKREYKHINYVDFLLEYTLLILSSSSNDIFR